MYVGMYVYIVHLYNTALPSVGDGKESSWLLVHSHWYIINIIFIYDILCMYAWYCMCRTLFRMHANIHLRMLKCNA